MTSITDNAVPTAGRTTSDEMIAFVLMTVVLATVPFTPIYPFFVMQALCFALFACAFNLLIGYGGLLSFGHCMFLGTAGYVTAHAVKIWGVAPELGVLLGVVAGVIAVTQAQRKIPVQYAQRAVGRKMYAGGTSFMPLKVNYAGVDMIKQLTTLSKSYGGIMFWEWTEDTTDEHSLWKTIQAGY